MVLGNIFFALLAGHETTGNSLAFTLLLLAIYPEYQKELQAELYRQLEGRLKQDWTIEKDYRALQKGYTGAVLQEVLRLYCVIQLIMRQTVAATTVVDSSGITHVISENKLCLSTSPPPFRTPKHGPSAKSHLSDGMSCVTRPHTTLTLRDGLTPVATTSKARKTAHQCIGRSGRVHALALEGNSRKWR